MKSRIWIVLLVVVGLGLTACAPSQVQAVDQGPASTPSDPVPAEPEPRQAEASPLLTLEDAQGAVTVKVTPLNLDQPGEELTFEVVLDTHSVDLSMDLATLASLATDTGKSVLATGWEAPSGGHHVSGKLSFPAQSAGSSLVEGAKTLTLTIQEVGEVERTFTWELD